VIRNLLDLLKRFEKLGDREALLYFNGYKSERYTYRQILGRIEAVRSLLRSRGLHRGSRIALVGSNRPEWVISFWAALSLGAEIVPVDSTFSPALIRRVLESTRTALVISGVDFQPGTPSPPVLRFDEIVRLRPETFRLEDHPLHDVVEIVFTSGTTGDPKGVIHRHRNITANLEPFYREFTRYRPAARIFQPIRILNLLPLSHMFGQAMGLFIPPLLEGSIVFSAATDPRVLVDLIRRERISVLACIPRFLLHLESLLKEESRTPLRNPRFTGIASIPERWWRYRRLHRRLGLKFWAIVVGGAAVPPRLEEFWSQVGILLIQGYGMTEASPIVAVNHPFHTRRGTIGRILEGQEVRLSEEGEILVRGQNVLTEYYHANGTISPVTCDGWLHTGDIGELDAEGNLLYRGRKKDVIVNSEGQNIFPEDVEAVLNRIPGIRESAVVAAETEAGAQVHAILVLDDGAGAAEDLIQAANRQLEVHQKIRSWSLWPYPELPRTPSTQKLQRSKIASLLSSRESASEQPTESYSPLNRILSKLSGLSPGELSRDARLEADLGLSSLDRVELMGSLEQFTHRELDEFSFSRIQTVGDLENLLKEISEPERVSGPGRESSGRSTDSPSTWPIRQPFKALRHFLQGWIVVPLFRHYIRMEVSGLDRFMSLDPPFLLAANHTSHLDAVALLAALPASLRSRIAPAVRQEYFQDYFSPAGAAHRARISSSVQYFFARLLFNVFPLPQQTQGTRTALRFMGQITSEGFCPLIFPEGKRSPDGRIQPFRPGIGLMALKLELPVIPAYLQGLFEIFSIHNTWPRKGRIRVVFGEPIWVRDSAGPESATAVIEQAIRSLAGSR